MSPVKLLPRKRSKIYRLPPVKVVAGPAGCYRLRVGKVTVKEIASKPLTLVKHEKR